MKMENDNPPYGSLQGPGSHPEIPLGLGMALAQDPGALSYFGGLNAQEQAKIIGYIQSAATGEDAKHRVRQTVQMMKDHTVNWNAF